MDKLKIKNNLHRDDGVDSDKEIIPTLIAPLSDDELTVAKTLSAPLSNDNLVNIDEENIQNEISEIQRLENISRQQLANEQELENEAVQNILPDNILPDNEMTNQEEQNNLDYAYEHLLNEYQTLNQLQMQQLNNYDSLDNPYVLPPPNAQEQLFIDEDDDTFSNPPIPLPLNNVKDDLFDDDSTIDENDEIINIEDININDELKSEKLSKHDILSLILFQEGHELDRPFENVIEGTIQYRVDLNDFSTALIADDGEWGGEDKDYLSPISLSIRTKQMLCSYSNPDSLSVEIPMIGTSQMIEKGRYTKGILNRAKLGISILDKATPYQFDIMISVINNYYDLITQTRDDMKYAYYGFMKELDPTKINKSKFARTAVLNSLFVTIEMRQGKYVPIWKGEEINIGNYIGIYMGRIVSSCDIIDKKYCINLNDVLIDSSIEAESNWTRYLLSNESNNKLSNVDFDEDGFVFTTRKILPGYSIVLE